jgi:hypothetical protein
MVQNNDISIGHLKTIQMLAGRLRIVYVLVNNIRRSSRFVRGPETNLPYCAILAENVVHLVASNLVRQTPNKRGSWEDPNACRKAAVSVRVRPTHAAKESSEEMSVRGTSYTYLTYNIRFTSGGRRPPALRTPVLIATRALGGGGRPRRPDERDLEAVV